ncbi:MAG TPA: TonB family protein [Allosphingosinicella sp.]|nr:TonB family protein [Allosphingosinicella sp.]
MNRSWNHDRTKAVIGVAVFHALLGYGLIAGLGFQLPEQVTDNFKVFDVPREEPPPPIVEPPAPKTKAKEPEGAASPPNIKSRPTPVVAPPPKVRLKVPPKIVTAPKALPVPPGNDPTAGSSNVVGPGTGSGGTGTGTGSGGSGTGSGGGGDGEGGGQFQPARRERGGFTRQDYNRLAKGRQVNGRVYVRYTVRPDGGVSGCTITRPSGWPDVDSTTCRLIEQRFHYKPATDPQGRPIPYVKNTYFTWSYLPIPE